MKIQIFYVRRCFIHPEDEEESRELFKLGSPQTRLMTMLAKDNEIKQWFSGWIGGIIKYRRRVLDKMSEFHNEVINANENMKRDNNKTNNSKITNTIYYPDEYNISKICSNLDSVYDYSYADNYEI
jgi:hypothetical protein